MQEFDDPLTYLEGIQRRLPSYNMGRASESPNSLRQARVASALMDQSFDYAQVLVSLGAALEHTSRFSVIQ